MNYFYLTVILTSLFLILYPGSYRVDEHNIFQMCINSNKINIYKLNLISSSSNISWWDFSYKHRTPIAISNFDSKDLPIGYSVSISIDTLHLINSGKLRADGNDLRIVWFNSTSKDWLELNRINETNFNTINTRISFKTQTSIMGGNKDDSYYLYYNNPSASAPPVDKKNVYDFYDDFTQPDGPAEGWNVTQGASWSVINSEYRESEGQVDKRSILNSYMVGNAEIQVQVKKKGSDFGLGVIFRYQNNKNFYTAGLGFWNYEIGLGKWTGGNSSMLDYTPNTETVLTNNQWYNLKIKAFDSQYLVYLDNVLKINYSDSDHLSPGQIGFITLAKNTESFFDELKIRLLVATDPVTYLRPEETIAPQFNFPFLIPPSSDNLIIILIVAACIVGSVMTTSVAISKKYSKKRSGKIRPKIPFKVIPSHVENISETKSLLGSNIVPKNSIGKVVTPQSQPEIEKQVEIIKKLGEELFAGGAYLEAYKQFQNAGELLLNSEKKNEAGFFLQKAKDIKELTDERERKIILLESLKPCGTKMEITNLYTGIIELSKKLNDSDGTSIYLTELDNYRISSESQSPGQAASQTEEIENLEVDEKLLEESLDTEILEIKKLGGELFAKGAYLQVFEHFKNAAGFLFSIEKNKEASIFLKKANQIKELIDKRNLLLRELEECKNKNNFILEILDHYEDVIEISIFLNDIEGIKKYTDELNEYYKINNINLRELELKIPILEEKAIRLESEYLFGAASDQYKECIKILNLLTRLGMKDENNNIEKFRTREKECLKRFFE